MTQGRKRLPAAERRQTLLDAAEDLIARQGYAATRLEDVAAAAGVSKQLLNRHFATKQELHLELLAKHRDGLVGVIGAAAAAQQAAGSPDGIQLPGLMDAWYGYLEANPFAARILLQDTTGVPEIAAFHAAVRVAGRSTAVAALRADPRVDIEERLLEPLAEAMRSSLVGLAQWWTSKPELRRDEIVDVAVLVIRGCVASFRTATPT